MARPSGYRDGYAIGAAAQVAEDMVTASDAGTIPIARADGTIWMPKDEDVVAYVGRLALGYYGTEDAAGIGHLDNFVLPALRQAAGGDVSIEGKSVLQIHANTVLGQRIEETLTRIYKRITLSDQGTDPVSIGQFLRNGTDLKYHDGVAVRTLLHDGDCSAFVMSAAPLGTYDMQGAGHTDDALHVYNPVTDGYVPSGTTAVVVDFSRNDGAVTSRLLVYFEGGGSSDLIFRCDTINQSLSDQFIAKLDGDGNFGAKATNTVWTACSLKIQGYVVPISI